MLHARLKQCPSLGLVPAGARERAQLARACDQRVGRAARAYQDAGYHDGRGADSSTAVKWWVRWTRAAKVSMVQRATVFDGDEAQRAVEDVLIMFAVWLVAMCAE